MKRNEFLRSFAVVLVAVGSWQIAWASAPALPAVQHAGPVSYLSGGVGLDESQAIKGAMHDYRLILEFAGKTTYGNEYLAGVPVTITDAHGKSVLETNANGPFMLVSLPPGRYTITASYGDKAEQRAVRVLPNSQIRALFLWQM